MSSLTMDAIDGPDPPSAALAIASQSDAPDATPLAVADQPLSSTSAAAPIFPFGRPVSSPDAGPPPVVPPGRFQPADPSNPHWYDRSSTASLPLPAHTPLHILPALRARLVPEPIVEVSTVGVAAPQAPVPPPPQISVQQLPLAPQVLRPPPPPPPSPFAVPPPPYSAHTSASLGSMNGSTSDYSPVVPARVRAAASNTSTPHSLPPPAPPTILAPPAPAASTTHRAPHETFLSDAPPPPDSWIAVETFPREYNIVVRLPGFRRDAMCVIYICSRRCDVGVVMISIAILTPLAFFLYRTLATRRRRVLHLVADSWEGGGGELLPR
jgi:hypothetical protein